MIYQLKMKSVALYALKVCQCYLTTFDGDV